MSTQLNPYLNFVDNAKEAMEFYQSVFGGELTSTTFAEAGGMGLPEEEQGKVMHSQLTGPDGLVLMGSDSPSHMQHDAMAGCSVSLSGDDDATLRGWWTALSDGAELGVPLEVAPWGDAFGMLTDKFGVPWLVNITGAANQG